MVKPLTRAKGALQCVNTPLVSVVDISSSSAGKSYSLLVTGRLTRIGKSSLKVLH